MQRVTFVLFELVLGCKLMGQTAWPPLCIQDVAWSDGTHHTAVTQPIEAPCSPSAPLATSGTADAEMVSGTEVHFMDGFHAGAFSGQGQFHAYVDEGLDAPADLVLIAPEPATHIVDNVVHVEKWEKLEVGLRLPQDYLNAIDSFFVHYYSNGTNNTATPDSVDRPHDLNPYADDSLQLVMTLTGPTGEHKLKWGFHMREARWPSTSDYARLNAYTTNPLDAYRIRFRFAPNEEGIWQFSIAVHAPHTYTMADVPLSSLTFSGYAFVCDPPLADNHGFLQVNPVNRRVLQFDDGTSFMGLGPNMADIRHAYVPSGGQTGFWFKYYQLDHRAMMRTMRQLHEVGGNYLRMMSMRELFAPEWVNAGVYDSYRTTAPCTDGSGITSNGNGQFQCWAFDRMLDSARLYDLYIQLCIDPNTPGTGAETGSWGSHAYVLHFLEPARDSLTGRYDIKRFFFTPDANGNPQYDSGVFYYWKRKYKYIMARWGYSVNLAAFEAFNEIDQLLTLRADTLDTQFGICAENAGPWPQDTALLATVDHWLTKISEYVRGPQVTADPVASPLGESRLFTLSYALSDPWMPQAASFYRSLANPVIDLIDAHMYVWPDTSEKNQPDWRMTFNFDKVQAYHDSFPAPDAPLEARKPVIAGEVNYSSQLKYGGEGYEFEKLFHNYDVSFHNELWSGVFSGKFATGLTWHWERVFMWDRSLKPAPPDPGQTGNQFQTTFYNVADSTNQLDVGLGFGYPVVNKPIHHNFKPLADMLNNPDLQASEFLNWDFTPHKIHDEEGGIECYYLLNEVGSMAIGWVHNLNAWGMNNFYFTHLIQNFLGCSSPDAQTVALTGFIWNHDFYITYFPTRLNGTVPPNDTVVSSFDGTVTLNLSEDALHGIANNYLDTLHSDYAFVISPYPVNRSMLVQDETDTLAAVSEWDFTMFPNPANDFIQILLPPADIARNIDLFDLAGKSMHSQICVNARTVRIPVCNLSNGTYCVRVSDANSRKMKVLIIH